jgi:hypothetical protein
VGGAALSLSWLLIVGVPGRRCACPNLDAFP